MNVSVPTKANRSGRRANNARCRNPQRIVLAAPIFRVNHSAVEGDTEVHLTHDLDVAVRAVNESFVVEEFDEFVGNFGEAIVVCKIRCAFGVRSELLHADAFTWVLEKKPFKGNGAFEMNCVAVLSEISRHRALLTHVREHHAIRGRSIEHHGDVLLVSRERTIRGLKNRAKGISAPKPELCEA